MSNGWSCLGRPRGTISTRTGATPIFFVEFIDYNIPTIADDWFSLQEELEKLLGRRVDLVSLRAAVNPYFLDVANRHKVTLYAA